VVVVVLMVSKPTGRPRGRPHRREFIDGVPALTDLQWLGVVLEVQRFDGEYDRPPFRCPPSWIAQDLGVTVRAIHKWRACPAYIAAVRWAGTAGAAICASFDPLLRLNWDESLEAVARRLRAEIKIRPNFRSHHSDAEDDM
jgi:hypothetical protein